MPWVGWLVEDKKGTVSSYRCAKQQNIKVSMISRRATSKLFLAIVWLTEEGKTIECLCFSPDLKKATV